MTAIEVILLSMFFCFCYAQLDDSRQARILKYDFANHGVGPYYFSFLTSDGIRRLEEAEFKNVGAEAVLVVRGEYSYTAPDGVVYTVRYTADENGFHPEVQGPNQNSPSRYGDNNGGYRNNYVPSAVLPTQTPTPVYATSHYNRPNVMVNTPQYVTKTPKPFLIDVFNQDSDQEENTKSTPTHTTPLTAYPHDYLLSSSRIVTKKLKTKRADAIDINSMTHH